MIAFSYLLRRGDGIQGRGQFACSAGNRHYLSVRRVRWPLWRVTSPTWSGNHPERQLDSLPTSPFRHYLSPRENIVVGQYFGDGP